MAATQSHAASNTEGDMLVPCLTTLSCLEQQHNPHHRHSVTGVGTQYSDVHPSPLPKEHCPRGPSLTLLGRCQPTGVVPQSAPPTSVLRHYKDALSVSSHTCRCPLPPLPPVFTVYRCFNTGFIAPLGWPHTTSGERKTVLRTCFKIPGSPYSVAGMSVGALKINVVVNLVLFSSS